MIIAALGAALVCVVVFLLWVRGLGQPPRVVFEKRTPSIMGTETTLKAVVERGGDVPAQQALQAAEAVLRDVEARMSIWVGTTELARFNAARAGEVVPLSPETLEVLRAAREVSEQTQGAFNPTCRPVFKPLEGLPGGRSRAPSGGTGPKRSAEWVGVGFDCRRRARRSSRTA